MQKLGWREMNSRTSILRFAISCLLLTIPLPAQNEIFVPANDVSFTISPERTRYRAGEQITLKYTTNISNAPLYTPRQWEVKCPRGSPHLWAWFENSSGQHFVPGYAGSCSPIGDPKTVSCPAEQRGNFAQARRILRRNPPTGYDPFRRLETRGVSHRGELVLLDARAIYRRRAV
jgi:hypothetical protein